MAEKKMTYSDALAKAIEVVTDEEVKERLVALKAQTEKRNATKSKKADKATEELKALILEGLENVGKPVTVTQLIKGYDALGDYSTQKLSPYLKALATDGFVKRETKGKDTLFSIISDEVVEDTPTEE